jgi:hypothetical protein
VYVVVNLWVMEKALQLCPDSEKELVKCISYGVLSFEVLFLIHFLSSF